MWLPMQGVLAPPRDRQEFADSRSLAGEGGGKVRPEHEELWILALSANSCPSWI